MTSKQDYKKIFEDKDLESAIKRVKTKRMNSGASIDSKYSKLLNCPSNPDGSQYY